MIRAYLVEELKRTFLPGIGIALALTVTTFLMNPLFALVLNSPVDLEDAVNAAVVFAMTFLTSAMASSAFGVSFRQGPLRLLENLPIPRYRIWLSRLLVCVLTTVASCGLLVVAHPTVITNNREGVVLAIAIAVLLFLGGLCWGMLIQSGTAAVVLLSLMMTIPLAVFIAVLNRFATDHAPRETVNFVITAAAFCAVYLVVIFLIFMRGEFEVTRRRFLNGMLLAGALLGTSAALIAFADLGVLAYGEEWVLMLQYPETTSWTASVNKRYLALIRHKEFHRSIAEAVVIDVESGKIVKTFRQNNLRQLLWTEDDTLIALSEGTILARLLGVGTGTAHATRIFPSEQQLLAKRRSEWAHGFRTRQWGTFASLNSALLRRDGVTSLIHLDAPGGAVETVSASWDAFSPPYDFPVRGGHFFRAYGPFSRLGWIIGEKIHTASHQWGPFFLPDAAAKKATQAEFWKNAPSPRTTATTRGAFVWSDNNTSFDEDGWVYFLEANTSSRLGRLLARRKSETSWKQVIDRFELSEKELRAMSGPNSEYSDASTYRLWTGFYNGIVVGIYRTAEKSRILVVNLVNGDRFDFEDDNSNKYLPGNGQAVNIFQREGAIDIRPIRTVRDNPLSLPVFYLYTPGSAPIAADRLRITATRPKHLAFSGPNGTQVFYDPLTDIFTTRSADGATRPLWPQ